MDAVYDMCVDYNTLCEIEDKLQKIEYDLNSSATKMVMSIQRSQNFLSGNQFEKAKNVTTNCVELAEKTAKNIKYARDYIEKLRFTLEEYDKCRYTGEA